MKKLNLVWAVLIASMLLFSCEKDEDDAAKSDKNVPVRERIIDFVNSVENTDRSVNVDNYTVEEGLWNIESGISLYRTRTNLNYSNIIRTTKSFQIHVDEGDMVSHANLQQLYTQVLAEMKVVWDAYEGDKKAYNLINIEYEPGSENNVVVHLKFTYGTDLSEVRSTNFSYLRRYNSNANFIYSEYASPNCDNSGGIDAARLINSEINFNHIMPILSQAGTYILNPVSFIIGPGDFPNPDDNDSYDNYYSCLLFSNNSIWPNYHTCLSKYEVQNYIVSTWTAINKKQADGFFKPEGNIVADLDLEGDLFPLQYSSEIFHRGPVTYGEKHMEDIIHVIGF